MVVRRAARLLWKPIRNDELRLRINPDRQASDAVQMTAGEIALMSPELDAAKAEAYRASLAVARKQFSRRGNEDEALKSRPGERPPASPPNAGRIT